MMALLITMAAVLMTYTYGVPVLTAGLINTPGSVLFSCPYLIFINKEALRALQRCLLFNIQIMAAAILIIGCFRSANHFLLSPDIIYYFNSLILILFHTLKLIKTPSDR